MGKTSSIPNLKKQANNEIRRIAGHLAESIDSQHSHRLPQWMAEMSTVQLFVAWERYAEKRLASALNHHSSHFLQSNGIHGIPRVPIGLASILVRGNKHFFDFHSTRDLMRQGTDLLGKSNNPFDRLLPAHEEYLDTLAAIRNYIVHGSDKARGAYRRRLKRTYGLRVFVAPKDFLSAIDHRNHNPLKGDPRIQGLLRMVQDAVART